MSLGSRIKERREALGFSVIELAAACDVSDKAVYFWESGNTKGLKPHNLVACADKLSCRVHWLVTGQGQMVRRRMRDELTADEDRVISGYRNLDSNLQKVVNSLVESLQSDSGRGQM